ncbi:hypothetical protein [Falsihalocynthiibacter arcticus]|uniref:Phage tail protein n=1 Tax=Falsihalocynthiibacter arcticus TaxID=1579316 RepID=A0A126V0Q5_9RHOB|nr:hypothetical protein [Falsihalocynthiibacter arcticus]AML51918.1 hypothetical protein RC74_12155 [Falsihalocynthiibacter arcticus]
MTDNPIFASRWAEILWQDLPETMRLYDNPQVRSFPDPANPADVVDVRLPGDLQAYIASFGNLMDQFEATLSQFYADGFVATSPADDPDARQVQPWLVPYFADLIGVTLYAPDPEGRRNELSQAVWIARRRGSRAAVDRAAESILDRDVITVVGLDRTLFTPTFKTPRLTQAEMTADAHVKDALILHEPLPANPTLTQMRQRHAAFPLGTRHTGLRMRARASQGLRLDAETKSVLDAAGVRKMLRFEVVDKAGVPCFANTYEDRALRTPDVRAPKVGPVSVSTIARPDAVYLHVAPPMGQFDETIHVLPTRPSFADGDWTGPAAPDPAKTPLYRPNSGNVTLLNLPNGRDGNGWYQITGLNLDGVLRIRPNCNVTLENCAIRDIEMSKNATLTLRHSICVSITANTLGSSCTLEYVTVTGPAVFRQLNASETIFADLRFGPNPQAGCLRYSRFVGPPLPASVSQRNSSTGAVSFVNWPCLPDPNAPATLQTRTANFGEPGYGILAQNNPVAVTNGAEDGGELGRYHDAFHLARLAAAARRAQDFTPAGQRVFAHYDMRTVAPLPVSGGI